MKKIINKVKKHKGYAKNASLYMLVTVISFVISLIINPFMAMNMSPEDYNITGYFSSFNVLLLPLLNFSLITYYSRNFFKLSDEKRVVVADTLLKALLGLGAILIPLITLIFTIYFRIVGVTLPIFPFFIFSVVTTFFNNFLVMNQVKFRMDRNAKGYFRLTLTSTLLTTASSLLMVVGFKMGAMGAMLAPTVMGILVAIYCYRKMNNGSKFDFNIVKDAFNFGWPLSLSAMLWYFLSGVDKAMLETFNDVDSFALYNIGGSIAGKLIIVYTALSQTFEPDIYQAIAKNNFKKALFINGGLIGMVALCSLFFIIFSQPIMKLITADRYTSAYMFANILSLKNITMTLYYGCISIIVGYGFTKYDLLIRVIGAGLCFIMYKVLIGNFQYYGAAWGQVFSFLVLSLIAAIIIIFVIFPKTKNQSG